MRRVRPGPVEDELAVAVGLEVERHRAEQPGPVLGAVAGEDDPGDAARRLPDALRRLQRRQKSVLEERIVVARQTIPLAGRDGRDALDDFQLDDASSLAKKTEPPGPEPAVGPGRPVLGLRSRWPRRAG
jgi:hypothetical protein